MLETFFRSLLSFSTCAVFFALVTAMIQSLVNDLVCFMWGRPPSAVRVAQRRYAFAAVSIGETSSRIPGPIVELSVHPLMYFPLATDGLALITLVMSTVAFSINLSGENEILPTGQCTSAVLSVRNSTLPAFTSCTALPTSK